MSNDTEWAVHKFGGTSVANAERYRNVADILEGMRGPQMPRAAVVVSAMAGVTNTLIGIVELAASRDAAYAHELRTLRERQVGAVRELLGSEGADALVGRIEGDFEDIEDLLRAVWLLRQPPRGAIDLISGYGELWSAQLLDAYLRSRGVASTWLDAREALVVDPSPLSPLVDWEVSRARLDLWLDTRAASEDEDEVVVITGFIAADPDGIPTTLGRNGSDYSASIFGALLEARAIHIWTDVDGVMSADPRLVPDAVVLDDMSYDEAMELAYFGARVIHPSTMAPAVHRQIPIWIKNSFRPEVPGTRIHLSSSESTLGVKGLATVDAMALVNVEGTSMIGVPGIASRLFAALREAEVSVVMISQGSSEHSICFVVPQLQAARARKAVEGAFFAERHHGQIETVDVVEGCTVLAVVGDRMAGSPGVAGSFFGALGKAGINIRAIAQGSSERNISVVVDSAQATRALRAVHSSFYLSPQTISIGLIGPGLVGSTLLRQLAEQVERLNAEARIDLRVRGIATSSRMLLSEGALELGAWKARLDDEGTPLDLEGFVDHVQTEAVPHAVLVDCTASDEVAGHYGAWLERGIHVITPNKKAGSGPMEAYRAIKARARRTQVHYLYETTVGAGLPIIQTLRDLIQTGDEILEIEGIFSGTLSYLFNAFDGSTPFSGIVRQAREKGFTEPDPRDDLSGMDVARKLVILAREMGLDLELDDVEVEPLYSGSLATGDVESFLARLPEVDADMQARLSEAKAAGQVLRFVGRVGRDGRASVRLRAYPATHPFGRIQLTDNIVRFRTRRYSENPLVVQGPGAGPAVTAGGVFADLLRLATYLGATL